MGRSEQEQKQREQRILDELRRIRRDSLETAERVARFLAWAERPALAGGGVKIWPCKTGGCLGHTAIHGGVCHKCHDTVAVDLGDVA